MTVKDAWQLIQNTFSDFVDDEVTTFAAALAYYTIFSLAPVLIIAIAIAGAVFGQSMAQQEVYDNLQQQIGPGAAGMLSHVMSGVGQYPHSRLAVVISIITITFGASSAFSQLQTSLNVIYGVRTGPRPAISGLWHVVRKRLLAFGMLLVVGFLLLVMLMLSVFMSAAEGYVDRDLAQSVHLWQWVSSAVTFGVTVLLFAAIYKVLPDVKMTWKSVWLGAVVTAVLFACGKYVIGVYLAKTSIASIYGAAGSVIVLLLWIYYCSIVFLLGAEFIQVYARFRGQPFVPNKYPQKEQTAPS